MKRNYWATPAFVLLLLLAGLACAIPGFSGTDEPAATPTPVGDTLSFTAPAYTVGLEPGETVPGTRLQYINRSGEGYEVSIDGLTAVKRTGDSFIWSGVLAPGVYANYNLRLATVLLGELRVGGPVEITALNPDPVALPEDTQLVATLQFDNILVNDVVPVGRAVPGSTLTYVGLRNDQGNRLAEFSGLAGYPYIAVGDSLRWFGKVRSNLALSYNLRTIAISETEVRLAGTAQLWVLAQ